MRAAGRGAGDPASLLARGGGTHAAVPSGSGRFGVSWGSGMLLAGRLWPWGYPVWGLWVHSLCLEPRDLAVFLPGGTRPLPPEGAEGSAVSRSPWGRCSGRCRGAAAILPSRGEGAGPVLCPGRAQEWPGRSCPAARSLACRWNRPGAGADPTLLLSPAASSFIPVPPARPGTDPFPRGSPTVFHNPRLCPDPSFGPDGSCSFSVPRGGG